MKEEGLAFVVVVGMILVLLAFLVLIAYLIGTDDGVLVEQARQKEVIEYCIEGPLSSDLGPILFFEPKY